MYGQENYGTLSYAVERAGGGVEEDHYTDLGTLVPEFVSSKLEMQELYRAQGNVIGFLQYSLADMIDQCFITSSTWGLDRWEELFSIDTNKQLSFEQRREILAVRLRGQEATTGAMIKEAAQTFSGGEADVREDNPHSLLVVRFIGIKGIPRNMQSFINMLEEIKPAHMAYLFEYRYTLWEELKPLTWKNLALTWRELRVMEKAA